MKKERVEILCDVCGADISVVGTGCHIVLLDKDLCKSCLRELLDQVDTEYRRLFIGQVRDLRGG